MNLFEEEPAPNKDWFDVCPNADELVISDVDDEKMKAFDALLLHTREWDRARVARVLNTAQCNQTYLLKVLNKTYPDNQAILFAARELLFKVPNQILCSVLAFAHDGSGSPRICFPDKREQPIPSTLLKAFGLRRSEAGWFDRLVGNESFVRMVAGNISEKDWSLIIHDKPTLLKTEAKRVTGCEKPDQWGQHLW